MTETAVLKLLPLPEHHSGKEIVVEDSVKLSTEQEKSSLLNKAVARLNDINNWHHIMNQNMAVFQLTDKTGRPSEAPEPEVGMLIRIDIAGPGSTAGEGYDWVEITQSREFDIEGLQGRFITVRPTSNPASGDEETAHFYKRSSSSTFLVFGQHCTVHAMVLDRNVEINTDNKSGMDSIRNTVYGTAGKAAFSKLQWQSLVTSFLKPEPD